jgi:hypothetical protein
LVVGVVVVVVVVSVATKSAVHLSVFARAAQQETVNKIVNFLTNQTVTEYNYHNCIDKPLLKRTFSLH